MFKCWPSYLWIAGSYMLLCFTVLWHFPNFDKLMYFFYNFETKNLKESPQDKHMFGH